jgi:hypothetical protein
MGIPIAYPPALPTPKWSLAFHHITICHNKPRSEHITTNQSHSSKSQGVVIGFSPHHH